MTAAHPEVVAKLTALTQRKNAEIGGDRPGARRPAGKVENPSMLYAAEPRKKRRKKRRKNKK